MRGMLGEYLYECLKERVEAKDEDTFLHLIELPKEAIPILIAAYEKETRPRIRAGIVEAAWHLRDRGSIDLLARAPGESDHETWKQALDGLVALGGPEAITALYIPRRFRAAVGSSPCSPLA